MGVTVFFSVLLSANSVPDTGIIAAMGPHDDPVILAFDIGTTGCKTALFESDGRFIGQRFSGYPTLRVENGGAEQDPESWWQAVCKTSQLLKIDYPSAFHRLGAVACCGIMNSCLPVDAHGEPLRYAMIHADRRSGEQTSQLVARIGDETAYQITGNRLEPYFSISKMLWYRQHESDLFARTRWFLQAKDYIAGRLTGCWGITDRSDASLTSCFDLKRNVWSGELLKAAGVPLRMMPAVIPSTTIIGKVTPEASRETGFSADVPVVLGGGDGACATQGAGAVKPGDAYLYLGGTAWLATLTAGLQPDPKMRLTAFCSLSPDFYVAYGTVQSAGSSVEWFLDAIGLGSVTDGDPYHQLDILAGQAEPGSRGLLFLPYLQGERSPIWNERACGLFFGLTSDHQRQHLARAVLEGVVFALSTVLDAFHDQGLIDKEDIRVIGGGARSDLWRRMMAAAFQRSLLVMTHQREATSCGAAAAAAVALGIVDDLSQADIFNPVHHREEPDAALAEGMHRWKPLFSAL